METLSPVQPPPQNHQTGGVMLMPDSQPAPEYAVHSSQTVAAGQKPHFVYKCLLNQHAQKLRKPPPIYQTQNEGSDHLPRFRSTVWVDGASYTSSSTFQQRKMSEMDASKVAYIAITQKAKTNALQFIQQDKTFCKCILAEFAAKKNTGKPVYETTQLVESVRVFRSYLYFNGGTYPGESGKSKKEAEQLVARSAIIQYLDSIFGTDMADIVCSKLRQYHEMNKVQEINSMHSGSNVLGAQAQVGHNFALNEPGTTIMAESSVAPKSSLVQGTIGPPTIPFSGVPHLIIPQLLIEAITRAPPIVIQPPVPQLSTEVVNPTIPLVIQPPKPQDVPVATQQTSPQVSVEPIKPVVTASLVLNPNPSALVNNSCTPVVSATTPATTNIIPQPKPEASSTQAPEYIPLGQASDKKRSKKSMKKARKKMRADAQIPVIPATSQVLPFSTQ